MGYDGYEQGYYYPNQVQQPAYYPPVYQYPQLQGLQNQEIKNQDFASELLHELADSGYAPYILGCAILGDLTAVVLRKKIRDFIKAVI